MPHVLLLIALKFLTLRRVFEAQSLFLLCEIILIFG